MDWCLANINNDFYNYIFVEETSIWINECPLYHMRLKSSLPQTVGFSSNSKIKLNLWGGISHLGATDFEVMRPNFDNYVFT